MWGRRGQWLVCFIDYLSIHLFRLHVILRSLNIQQINTLMGSSEDDPLQTDVNADSIVSYHYQHAMHEVVGGEVFNFVRDPIANVC